MEEKTGSRKFKLWPVDANVITSIIAVIVAGLALWVGYIAYLKQKAALETELRPYLSIQLHRGKYLDIDDNSRQVYIKDFHIENGTSYLDIPCSWKNTGKIPALDIEAEYSGPVQDSQIFASTAVTNDVAPDDRSAFHVPWVNVSGYTDKNFETTLRIKYRGNKDIDPRTYTSSLLLQFERKQMDKGLFILKWSKIKFD